jgi:hypothetical protein
MKKKKNSETIIENNQRISIMIDESTNVSRKSALVMCLRCSFSLDGEPVSFFWDLIELEATTAQAIMNACLNNLKSCGMNEELKKKKKRRLISFAWDGASVMLGRKEGVAAELKKLFPSLFI